MLNRHTRDSDQGSPTPKNDALDRGAPDQGAPAPANGAPSWGAPSPTVGAPEHSDEDSQPLARIETGNPSAPTTIYLLHGITSCAGAMADLQLRLAHPSRRIIALDARGHGLSPRWSDDQLARAGDQLIDDVVNAIERDRACRRSPSHQIFHQAASPSGTNRGPRTILIGHSMGAATAAAVALRRPDLVDAVVAEDPARFGSRSLEELHERGKLRAAKIQETANDLVGALTRELAAGAAPSSEILPCLWASQQCDPRLLQTGVVAPEIKWEEVMAGLKVPTLVVTGDVVGESRVGLEGMEILRQIGNRCVECVIVHGGVHNVRRSRPQGYFEAVLPFIARIEASGRGGGNHWLTRVDGDVAEGSAGSSE